MKLTIKKLLMTALLFGMGTGLFAEALDNNNAIGMYVLFSKDSIGGLQYERRFGDVVSTKFGTFASVNNGATYYYGSNTSVEVNFVVEPDFCLYKTSWNDKVSSRLFAFGLLGYDFMNSTDRVYADENDTTGHLEESQVHSALAGFGFGFDFIFFDHLSIPIQFGYMGRINTDNPNFGFCCGISLRYSW